MSDFSIVTATFNAGGSIRRCLQSVRENRLAETEHLVIDNQSSDDTLEKVRAFGNVRVISEKDNGIYEAMNKGIRSAGNELTACLNADDAYLPGTLEAVKERFESVPESDIVYGNILVNGREVKPPGGLHRSEAPGFFIRRLSSGGLCLKGSGISTNPSGSAPTLIFSCVQKSREPSSPIWTVR